MARSDCPSLSLPLNLNLPYSGKPIIAEHLWNLHSPLLDTQTQPYGNELFQQYFRPNGYYLQQCGLGYSSLASVQTHRDLIDLAQLIWQPLPKADLLKLIDQSLGPASETKQSMSLNLVSRLILMMKVGIFTDECIGKNQLDWKFGTLQEFVHGHFNQPPRKDHERLKLEKTFNALNLHRIAGINIKWTDNLADHLKLLNDDKTVAVFRHASFLNVQRHNPIYPAGLINETIQTLALLFPQDDLSIRKWLQRVSKTLRLPLDRHLNKCGILDAENRDFEYFKFWHDRLVVLKQVYNETRPADISQRWYDRRHPSEWYTVWTAILVIFLTVFFGFIQIALTGVQVYLALKAP